MKAIKLIILLIAVLVGIYLFNKPKLEESTPDINYDVQINEIDSSSEEALTKSLDERYVEFSENNVEEYSNKKRVLFFYANWCPTCKPADKDFILKEMDIPQDMVVIRVNYNDSDTDKQEKNLAAKYGVTYQHTFVLIDTNGEIVTKWNGGGFDELIEKTK